ncbi:MAG: hypothetical protein IPO40_06015 [Fibrobacteres bacterium]|nr:hypothetical protein [Fibrobacterota bacterium]
MKPNNNGRIAMKNREKFKTQWPFKWWGFGDGAYLAKVEHVQREDFIDDQWVVENREEIIRYLKSAPMVLAGMLPEEPCPECGKPVYFAGIHCDDEWAWSSYIAHYVEFHGCYIPDSLAKWIASRNYLPPTNIESRYPNIPLPEHDAKKLGIPYPEESSL